MKLSQLTPAMWPQSFTSSQLRKKLKDNLGQVVWSSFLHFHLLSFWLHTYLVTFLQRPVMLDERYDTSMESVTRTKHETCLIPRSHLFYISLHFTFSSIFVCSINSKITILHESSVQSYRIPRRAKQNSEKTFRSKTKSFQRLDFSRRNSFYLFCYT